MSVQIVDYVRLLNPDQTPKTRTGFLYALPTRLNIFVLSSTGLWQAWTADPSVSDSRFKAAIKIPISDIGEIRVKLPNTDVELYSPSGSVNWQIWDPDANIYYEGPLAASIGTVVSLKDLCESHSWTVQPISTIAQSMIDGAPVTQEFISAPAQTVFTLSAPHAVSVVYRNGVRCRRVVSGPVTAEQFTISGVTITFGSGLLSGDVVIVDNWG